MDLFLFALTHDWPVLLPILLCSVLLLAVAIERYYFYNRNKRDVVQFIHRIQRELQRGNVENAQILSSQLGGVYGEVAEEGIRVMSEQPDGFDRSYDISAALAVRRLEKNLSALGTIATISPYLGLFGTVVRILFTFGDLSKAGNAQGAPEIMFGIGSALIATAFGLMVAIAAVVLNNYFRSTVSDYEDDFQLLKLVFVSYTDTHSSVETKAPSASQLERGLAQRYTKQAPDLGGY
jgi:biopolymer transport protein ExbB